MPVVSYTAFSSIVNNKFSGSLTVRSNITCNTRINFPVGSLGTTYVGSRIILWPGTGLSSSTDWYGLGMNSVTTVCNVP